MVDTNHIDIGTFRVDTNNIASESAPKHALEPQSASLPSAGRGANVHVEELTFTR